MNPSYGRSPSVLKTSTWHIHLSWRGLIIHNRDPFHGYWPKDIYALNENFGTEEDLISLSDALHARGMYLMLDVVPNHMASPGPFNVTDWSGFHPFNSSSYFHSPCWIDYENTTSVQVCMSGDTEGRVTLADLRTENTTVRQILSAWIKDTVNKYKVDGLRLDSAKHIEPGFWPDFFASAGVFSMAEYFDGDPDVFPSVMDTFPGAMNYPVFYWLQRAFGRIQGDFTELITGIQKMKSTLKTSTLAMFLDNNDQKRWAGVAPDLARAKNGMALAHLADGFPITYYGTEARFSGVGDPSNRQWLWSSEYRTDAELYQWLRKLNRIRALVIAEDPAFIPYQAEPSPIYAAASNVTQGMNATNATQAANTSTTAAVTMMTMRKSDVVSVLTNVGLGGARSNITLDASSTLYIADTVYVDLISCERFKTTSNGQLSFQMAEQPRVFFPASKVDNQAAQPGDEDTCGSNYIPSGEPQTSSCLVTFNLTASTVPGESMELLGDLLQLGNGDIHQAVALDASTYPVWTVTVELPAGAEVSYQFLRYNWEGTVDWDGGAKDAVVNSYSVPESCGNRDVELAPSRIFSDPTVLKPRLVRRRY